MFVQGVHIRGPWVKDVPEISALPIPDHFKFQKNFNETFFSLHLQKESQFRPMLCNLDRVI